MDPEKGIYRDGIKVPPGFIPIEEWKAAHPGEEPPQELLREMQAKDKVEEGEAIYYQRLGQLEANPDLDTSTWSGPTREHITFVLEEGNEDYVRFLDQCREDSKALEEALQKALDERGAKIWVKLKRRPKDKKSWRRMAFLIRPPMFKSFLEDKSHRTQANEKVDKFILHLDENHELHRVREWGSKFVMTEAFRSWMKSALAHERDFMRENYGDWDKWADLFARMIVSLVSMTDPSDQSQVREDWYIDDEE